MNQSELALAIAAEIATYASFESEEVKASLSVVALAAIEADHILHGEIYEAVYLKTAVGVVYRSYLMGGFRSHISQTSSINPAVAPVAKKPTAYKIQYPESKGLARFDVFLDCKEAELVRKAQAAALRAKHTRDRSLLPMLNLLQSGSTPEEAAGRLGVSLATIGNWMTHLAE